MTFWEKIIPTRKLLTVAALALLPSSSALAQSTAFSFLDLPASSTQNALGGQNVSLVGQNTLAFFQNPAQLDSLSRTSVAASYAPIYGQGNLFSLAYQLPSAPTTFWALGIRGLSNGNFVGRDAVGSTTSNFGAGHLAFQAAFAQRRNAITFGVSTKLAASFIASYSSLALLTDLGGTYQYKNISFGLVAQNVGVSLTKFSYVQQLLPFNLLLGLSLKPRYMPARFSFTADRLYQRNPYVEASFSPSTFQQILGHFSLGTEVFLHKNFHFLAGYNYRLNQTMRFDDKNRFGGISYGIRLQTKRMTFGCSRAAIFPTVGRWIFDASWQLN